MIELLRRSSTGADPLDVVVQVFGPFSRVVNLGFTTEIDRDFGRQAGLRHHLHDARVIGVVDVIEHQRADRDAGEFIFRVPGERIGHAAARF